MREEFDVYNKEYTIETRTGTKKYVLMPLRGEFLPELTELIAYISDQGIDEDNATRIALDKKIVSVLHKLVFHTLKDSLNVADKDNKQLDFFVSQNVYSFLEPIIDVNMGSVKNDG